METLNVIISVIQVILAVAVTFLVLLQQGKRAGLSGAIAGGAETFFGKNKAKSYEGKLALATKISASAFIVLSIVITAIS